jgi:ectoine hydroxylase-related dioxygenase (phytanoyl-CoA dioxygenase family)
MNLWIPFDAIDGITSQIGGLDLWRGSHKYGWMAHTRVDDGFVKWNSVIMPKDIENESVSTPTLRPGDCVVFDSRVIHASRTVSRDQYVRKTIVGRLCVGYNSPYVAGSYTENLQLPYPTADNLQLYTSPGAP